MAINVSIQNNSESIMNSVMTAQLDLEELKTNVDHMFLIINGIIVSCEYFHVIILLFSQFRNSFLFINILLLI